MLVALLVLLIRERKWFSMIPGWLRKAWVLFVVLWVSVAVCFQYKATQMLQDCISRYCADPQGITSLPSIRAGVFQTSFWHANYDWCPVSFMLEYGGAAPMTSFSPWLYDSLYLEPEKFFAEAVPVSGTPCYMTPKAPRVLVAKGDVVPSEETCAIMAKQLEENAKERKLPWFVSARNVEGFSKREDRRQWFAKPRFVFTAKDGKAYTIFSGDKPEEWMK